MRSTSRIALALGLCATMAMSVGCGDDDETPDGGVLDGAVVRDTGVVVRPDTGTPGPDTGVPGPDTGVETPDTGVETPDSGTDGGVPQPVLFSDFVKGLITNQTNATSSPVALPAPGAFVDTEDQSEYQSLFP